MKRALIFIILIILSISLVCSAELGFVLGNINKDTGLSIGFSAGMGMIIPMLKIEYELMKNIDELNQTITTGLKLKPVFGSFAPYGIIGVGTDFEKISFDLSSYSTFTFYGGGIYIYFGKLFSIRFDLRLYNYKYITKSRISGGVYLNL